MLEEYIYQLYGYRNKSTDSVRFKNYYNRYTKESSALHGYASLMQLCFTITYSQNIVEATH